MKDLSSDLHGKWHHLYFDNFFTSKKLMCDLESSGTYGCGTVRKNWKGFPEELKIIEVFCHSVFYLLFFLLVGTCLLSSLTMSLHQPGKTGRLLVL